MKLPPINFEQWLIKWEKNAYKGQFIKQISSFHLKKRKNNYFDQEENKIMSFFDNLPIYESDDEHDYDDECKRNASEKSKSINSKRNKEHR